MSATYKLEVKWDGASWTDETSRCMSADIDRGRDGGPLGRVKTGQMNLTMRNDGKRFSPAYASSAIYDYLLPNKQVRLRANYGRCVSLNGSSQYLAMATDDAHFKITTQITVGCWMYATAAPSAAPDFIMGKGGAWLLTFTEALGDYYIDWQVVLGGGTGAGGQFSPASINTWYHVVGTYDGAYGRLYINGADVSNTAMTGLITDTTYKVTIGDYYATYGAFFAGKVAYPFIYDRALSADEIQFMYNHGAGYIGYDDHLMGHWRFYSQDATDSSGNSHTLTATGSPTYPLVTDLYDAVLFTGYTQSFKPSPDQKSCTIGCQDELAKMQNKTTQTAIQTAKDTGELIDAVLTDYGFSATNRLIDTGASEIPVSGWSDQEANSLCQTIAEGEHGLFYFDAAGWAIFEDRNHRRTAPHTSTQADFNETTLTGIVDYEKDDADIRNLIRVKVHPKKAQTSTAVIWKLYTTPYIASGGTLTLYAKFRDLTTGKEMKASDITALASSTDYTANAQADGGGADKTANLSIVKTDYAEQSKLVLTATANLYVTKLQIRGKLYEDLDEEEVIAEDTTSQTAYGKRTMDFSNELIQDTDTATQFATLFKGRYANCYGRTGFTFYGHRNAAHLEKAMTLTLSDRIDITDSATGLADASYFIEAVNHRIEAGGKYHTVTLKLDPVVAEGYWILGTSEFDGETIVAF